MSLSDVAIRKAKPSTKPYKVSDGRGLFLLVQPSGSKWWRYKYRFAGKEKLLALGTYPDVSLSDARERHAEARKLVGAGKDPSEIKQEAKRLVLLNSGNTFEAVAREWHKSRLDQWTPLYAAKILKSFEADAFPRFGGRPVADITAAQILAAMRRVESRGANETAHRLLRNCGRVFSYAVVTQRLKQNPTPDLLGALKPTQKRNNAYLKADEIPEFFTRLEKLDAESQTKLALRFLLLTFVRTIELRRAAWKEIDFDKSEWRIPAERMKMRKPHIVPLSRQSVQVLRALQRETGHRELLFPQKRKPMLFISANTILYALYRMGYKDRATGHGFRSTASTILNEHGFHPDVIERQLAHCERNTVRAAYNHAEYLPERRVMMQWWGNYLDAVAKGNPVPRVERIKSI